MDGSPIESCSRATHPWPQAVLIFVLARRGTLASVPQKRTTIVGIFRPFRASRKFESSATVSFELVKKWINVSKNNS